MKKTQTDSGATINEVEIVEYLRAHRDFLTRHAELVAELEIPHAGADGTISLIERQVEMLRERQQMSQQQLRDLVNTARDNERLAERLHTIAVELSALKDFSHALQRVPTIVRDNLLVDFAALRVEANGIPESAEVVDPEADPVYVDLRNRVAHGRAVCDDRVAARLLEYLFGATAEPVQSCALIPLTGRPLLGLIALGSTDQRRFGLDMGTWYLDRLGELISATLRRLRT